MITQLFLQNFRCFHQHQETRLAPLTFLVGNNSTGKTSFLALIRALWDLAYSNRMPDFKEDPYDLGSFDEIAHHRGAKGGRADSFNMGFLEKTKKSSRTFNFTFGKRGSYPVLTQRRLTQGNAWSDETFGANGKPYVIRVGTKNGSWIGKDHEESTSSLVADRLPLPVSRLTLSRTGRFRGDNQFFQPLDGSPDMALHDLEQLHRLGTAVSLRHVRARPIASAPVRSKPRRTYDPARSIADPEGDYIPMFLAEVFLRSQDDWKELKQALEEFGQVSGLFDEIRIKPLGRSDSDPFQIQIRKFGKSGRQLKGPHRNLRDVGYGVSQVLPVITELLREHTGVPSPSLFLLQQPEVHLHPSAQAALGSLFSKIASASRQVVVETHSDYMIDRVRIDVRDGETHLRPEDISILYFEQSGLEVNIHSLQIDGEGNILDLPAGYRHFFLEETKRTLRI